MSINRPIEIVIDEGFEVKYIEKYLKGGEFPFNISCIMNGEKYDAIKSYEVLRNLIEKEMKTSTLSELNTLRKILSAVNASSGNNPYLSFYTRFNYSRLENKIKKKIIKEESHLTSLKNTYLLGNESAKKFKKIEKAAIKERNVAIEYGPLNKNKETYQLEKLIKTLLEDDSKVKFEISNDNLIVCTIQEKDNSTNRLNLSKILKNANFNHLNFTEQELESYLSYLERNQNKLHYVAALDMGADQARTKPEFAHLCDRFRKQGADEVMQNVSDPERIAINIYTNDFYRESNALLRGKITQEMNANPNNLISELLVTSAVCISGLNKVSEEVGLTYRSEMNLSQEVLDKRMKSVKDGEITLEMGLISTALDKPCDFYGFKSKEDESIGIVIANARGKIVSCVSAYPDEQEYLLPPQQMQWNYKTEVDGGMVFIARPVSTPIGVEKYTTSELSIGNEPDKNIDLTILQIIQTISAIQETLANLNYKFNPNPIECENLRKILLALTNIYCGYEDRIFTKEEFTNLAIKLKELSSELPMYVDSVMKQLLSKETMRNLSGKKIETILKVIDETSKTLPILTNALGAKIGPQVSQEAEQIKVNAENLAKKTQNSIDNLNSKLIEVRKENKFFKKLSTFTIGKRLNDTNPEKVFKEPIVLTRIDNKKPEDPNIPHQQSKIEEKKERPVTQKINYSNKLGRN